MSLALAIALLIGVTAFRRAEAGDESGAPPIRDNSFLLEEAYNQESRVVQHIGNWTRLEPAGEYAFSFTQEWPLLSQRQQLSYTLLRVSRSDAGGSAEGWGDFAVHYRYQALGAGGGRVAFAPRASVLLPTGDAAESLGAGSAGGQLNLPLSAELSARFASHTNLGFTYVGGAGSTRATVAWNVGQSLVWLARPGLNPLVELAWYRVAPAGGGAGEREESFLVSPGLRWAHDLPSGLQIVPGIALPFGVGAQRGDSATLLYLSLEHGF